MNLSFYSLSQAAWSRPTVSQRDFTIQQALWPGHFSSLSDSLLRTGPPNDQGDKLNEVRKIK